MRIVMVTDDVQIDRRILLEGETLSRYGHEVILLAEKGPDMDSFEHIGNVKVERVQYPLYSVSESRFLQASSFLSGALSRLSSLLLRVINMLSRVISKAANFLSITVSEGFSHAIVFNQRATILALHQWRRLRRLSLQERVLIDRIVFYNPDFIHVHDLPRLRVGVVAKKKLHVPLIYDAHELYPEIVTLTPTQRRLLARRERRYIKEATSVITVNEYIANEMSKRYGIKPPLVILNATSWPASLERGKPWDNFRERFAIEKDQKILLFQGWMSHTRGLQVLIHAMKRVPEHVHLVCMGYGDARPQLEAIAAMEGLNQRVHFMDAVPQDELLGWTASADMGIIPYQPVDLNTYYCSPNKLYEFIQADVPIIANDLPYLRQVIAGEQFGIVRRLSSIEDFASAIRVMCSDYEAHHTLDRMKKNIARRRHVYSWEEEQKKLLKLYFDLGCLSSLKQQDIVPTRQTSRAL